MFLKGFYNIDHIKLWYFESESGGELISTIFGDLDEIFVKRVYSLERLRQKLRNLISGGVLGGRSNIWLYLLVETPEKHLLIF